MRKLPFVLPAIAFLLPSLCHAQESCPWFNQASAAGVLDSAVGLVVTHPDPDHKVDMICDFTSKAGPAARQLRIDVRTKGRAGGDLGLATAKCTAKPVAVNAVGNEALACSLDAKNGQRTEQVAGRMRDRIFVVQISTNDRAWVVDDELRERTRSVADQVAGNLF
ncbi:MAG TPA: hypothetical protein VK604_04525 [Bryobacteraceae bacterium]|nr:hypothetical protein [Bryobacteraceae bacterium]